MKKIILTFLILNSIFCISSYAQWQYVNGTAGSVGNTINCFAVKGTNIFAGTIDSGVYLSTDNGDNWTLANNGDTATNPAVYVTSFAISGNNIFAGTAGIAGMGNGVFLSTDDGANWTRVNNGLPNKIVAALATSGDNIFAGIYNGEIFLSTDTGANWTAVNTGLICNYVLELAVSGNNIFAGTDSGIFLSNNNGANWTAVNTGLISKNISGLAISGANIFAGTDSGIFLSNNNGASWTAVNNGLKYVSAFGIDGTNIFVGYANSSGGVFLSTDTGATWSAVNTGIEAITSNIASLSVIGTNVFVGFGNFGIWKRPLSEMTGIEEVGSGGEQVAVSVYPNPASNKLNFKIENGKTAIIELYDIMGKQLLQQNITSSALINLSNLSSGIYFYKITDKEKRTARGKIAIQ